MTTLSQIQAAADRCTAQHGADRTAQIIDDAAELGFSDAQLVTALDAGLHAESLAITTPAELRAFLQTLARARVAAKAAKLAARPWYDAPSVQSLIRAARLTDAERDLLNARLHAESPAITTPAELRAFLQTLARARVAAKAAKLAARPWYDAPSVQSLIRAARLTDAERDLLNARLHAESLGITTPAELRAFLQTLARARVAAKVAKLAPLPESELADVARLAGDLARAQRAAEVAEANDAHNTGATILQATEVKVVVAGEVAYVDSATRQGVRYRVDLEGGVPRSCTCRDGRALVGACKHARAAYECARFGDGTYQGTLSPQPRAQRALAVGR